VLIPNENLVWRHEGILQGLQSVIRHRIFSNGGDVNSVQVRSLIDPLLMAKSILRMISSISRAAAVIRKSRSSIRNNDDACRAPESARLASASNGLPCPPAGAN
jgi:hypothetical protein